MAVRCLAQTMKEDTKKALMTVMAVNATVQKAVEIRAVRNFMIQAMTKASTMDATAAAVIRG